MQRAKILTRCCVQPVRGDKTWFALIVKVQANQLVTNVMGVVGQVVLVVLALVEKAASFAEVLGDRLAIIL